MAAPIIAAVRARTDLKESLLHTAQEIAHRASIYGVARMSYSYLALKCHCSRRTIIRHIQRLIDAGILRKSVLWICGHYCEVNTYAFRLRWDKCPATQGSDKTASKFPPRTQEREKYGNLKEKKRQDARGLSFLTPGSALYRLVVAHQAHTEGGDGSAGWSL
jgi:Helix-turn-helix domain